MSIGSILGLVVGLVLFAGAIALKTSNPQLFLDASSFIMVVGGTLSSAFMGWQSRYVLSALKSMAAIFGHEPVARGVLQQDTAKIIRWGHLVQTKGMPALEREIKDGENELLKYGIELVVTGYDGSEVRDMMAQAARAQFQRESAAFNILRSMGGNAPAWGMIGTLVGLVILMDNLGEDPAAIGAGLAVALLTTLYGVLFARLLFLPSASKLQQRAEISMFRAYLVTEGFAMIADGQSPRYITDKMNSYLDPNIHVTVEAAMTGRTAMPKKKKR